MAKSKLPLQNKVALVTGAAGAIGYGISGVLLENSCLLAASDLAGEELEALTGELKEEFPSEIFPNLLIP